MMTVLVNDCVDALDLTRSLDEISAERRTYALKYRFDDDRRQSVAVYLLLKEALRRDFGLEGNPRLELGSNGKPFLFDHPEIHFNFSHCPNVAACVVADRPVGIDVERISPINEDVAKFVLNNEEWRIVQTSAAPEIAFARYWTRKEALVKLSGRGLEDDGIRTLLTDARDVTFNTVERPDKGYVLTTAVEGSTADCGIG